MTPEETRKLGGECPVCHKPLTVGVLYRVGELAGKSEEFKSAQHKTVEYIIPLAEMIAEIKGVKSVSGKSVVSEYEEICAALGNEFYILREAPLDDISKVGFPDIAFAIKNMRAGRVTLNPGYDGVYGVIKALPDKMQVTKMHGQKALF